MSSASALRVEGWVSPGLIWF